MHVDAGGARLWIGHDEGPRGATPLVLLHGFTGSWATWEPLLPALRAKARTIAPDLVGHGASDAPTDEKLYTMDACVAQLLGAMDRLEVERGDWVGYSMGGRVALTLALAAPQRVRRLVLVGAGPGIRDPGERAERAAHDRELGERIEREGVEAFASWWEQRPIFAGQPEQLRARLRAQRIRHTSRGLAHALRGLGQGAMEPLWDRLHDVRCPVLLIAGENDLKYRAVMDAMADRMPAAWRATIQGAGHACHLEAPERWLAAVVPFLQMTMENRTIAPN